MSAIKKVRSLVKRLVPLSIRESIRYGKGKKQFRAIAATRGSAGDLPFGANVYGSVSAAFGLSEACRGLIAGLEGAGVPVSVRDFKQKTQDETDAPYCVNIFYANPNHLPAVLEQIAPPLWKRRYNIGCWLWEQERLPGQWKRFFPLFDEIWTPSEFVASAIRKDCSLPVTVIPCLVEPTFDATRGRAFFGLPEGVFLVLIAFDYYSVIERKNPEGAIAAFRAAFGDADDVALAIKARNLPQTEQLRLRGLLGEKSKVFFLTDDYDKTAVNSLLRSVDVYVSLHRAEGFGLILAECMRLGTPVVATNWSSNTEFMNDSVACMVPASLVTLRKTCYPFLKGSRWAEPDTAAAAAHLRRLKDDPAFRAQIAARGREHAERLLGREAVSAACAARMRAIAAMLGKEGEFPPQKQ